MGKELEKATVRDLSKRDLSHIPDTEVKALIIWILTGVAKRVEE